MRRSAVVQIVAAGLQFQLPRGVERAVAQHLVEPPQHAGAGVQLVGAVGDAGQLKLAVEDRFLILAQHGFDLRAEHADQLAQPHGVGLELARDARRPSGELKSDSILRPAKPPSLPRLPSGRLDRVEHALELQARRRACRPGP